MATKKRRFKRPTIENVYIANVSKAEDANAMMYKLTDERVKASNLDLEKGDDVPQPSWRDVNILLQGQIDLLRLLGGLYAQLEDPAVAHVVELKKSIDEMKNQIDEIRNEFNRHEGNYSHDLRDPYY